MNNICNVVYQKLTILGSCYAISCGLCLSFESCKLDVLLTGKISRIWGWSVIHVRHLLKQGDAYPWSEALSAQTVVFEERSLD